jgi:hypothetical protein
MKITVKEIIDESLAAGLLIFYILWMILYEELKKPLSDERLENDYD